MTPEKLKRIREMLKDYDTGDTGARLELMLQAKVFIDALLDHIDALEAERTLQREVNALAIKALGPFARAYDGQSLDHLKASDWITVQSQVSHLRFAAQAHGALITQRQRQHQLTA
jgi:hypothetical protein